MVRKLIEWAVNNPLIVILATLALAAGGGYCFWNVNVEAYPDPAPAIIEVVAQYPGASAEEVERQVTIPLEITLAGMPGLKYTRSKSLFGLSHLRNQFEYGVDFYAARQEVINRLQFTQNLPAGVTPQISPETPTGELMRYTLLNPRDDRGRPIYSLNDLKALEDWTLEREFKRVPRIIDVSSFGGTVKRYEIHPDPDRLKWYGITLQQLQTAIGNSNANVGGDILRAGPAAMNVRGIGLIGGGQDPMHARQVLALEEGELKAWMAADPNLAPETRQRIAEAFKGEKVSPPLRADEQRLVHTLRHDLGIMAAQKAEAFLRSEEERRLRDMRRIVITSVNNVPVRIEHVVEGGPVLSPGQEVGQQGVVIGHQTRLGNVSISRPKKDAQGHVIMKDGQVVWEDDEDAVMGTVLMRKNEETLPALEGVKAKMEELNTHPGRLLPGVQIVPHFDLTGLIHVTTETVRENLLLGMILVTVILLMFLSNVRSALIVAINIPLALLFAFAMLFLRGKSANLLSIGAVDFGIIVDSSVIMVENIYRHISSGEYADLPLKQRIVRASHEVERSLFFSTAIMVCAFIPLFTMQGPEGQIFGPMADTYAFALGGALLLALVLAPVLCLLLFKHLKPARDNLLVRWLKTSYLKQLERCLNHRVLTLLVFAVLIGVTAAVVPFLGREFMPELEEGNLYIRGTFPVNVSLEETGDKVRSARSIIHSYPEVELVQSQVGRPDDGTDPTGFYNAEFSVPLKSQKEWPIPRTFFKPGQGVRGQIVAVDADQDRFTIRTTDIGEEREFHITAATRIATGGGREIKDRLKDPVFAPGTDVVVLFAHDGKSVQEVRKEYTRPRSKPELIEDMRDELDRLIIGVDWNFSQYIRDNVMEALSGVKGDNSVKIIGPDLDELEKVAYQVKAVLNDVRGIEDADVFRIMGQPNLEIPPDARKCESWGVSKADVENAIQVAVGGRAVTQMVEGEKQFDITVRWPERLRNNEHAILNIPVDVANNTVTGGNTPSVAPTNMTAAASGVSPLGFSGTWFTLGGSVYNGYLSNLSSTPRRRLGDLVTPVDSNGRPDPKGSFVRPGASTIYREQGNRLIAVKFSVRGRDLGGAVAEAQEKIKPLIKAPYRTEWSGEFQEMQEAEHRLMYIIPFSLILIFILLYLAFHSLLDAILVLSNVLALSLGGVWALLLTHTNFSISAAVGFISIFGVAIMDGLLLVSYFNQLRFQGLPLRQAIMHGAEKRVRPVMMTALTAIFGLLPAALSTRIGAQTQRPLAIVVVGGMITTLFLTRYLMPVLYSFYGHREPAGEASRLAH